MGVDEWPLYEDPYDDDEHYDDEPCDCEDEDFDLLEGRACCYRCGAARTLSNEELKAELQRQAVMCEAIAAEFER